MIDNWTSQSAEEVIEEQQTLLSLSGAGDEAGILKRLVGNELFIRKVNWNCLTFENILTHVKSYWKAKNTKELTSRRGPMTSILRTFPIWQTLI